MQIESQNLERISGMGCQEFFEQHYITAPQIARELDITTPAIYSAVKKGRFPVPNVRIPGCGVWLWLRTNVNKPIADWKHARMQYGANDHVGRAGAV